jgi:hypothetical protein
MGLGSGSAIDAAGAGGSSFGAAGAGGSSFGAAGAGGSNSSASGAGTLAAIGTAGVMGSTGSAGISAPPPSVGPVPTGGAGALPRGKLDIAFTTIPPAPEWLGMGFYDKGGPSLTYGTVWITDDKGRLVKTLERWGIEYWYGNQYDYVSPFAPPGCSIDVVAQATKVFAGHLPHMVPWDGHNFEGKLAKDGDYILWILVEIDENEHIRMKPAHTGLTLTYTPQ